jgi:4-hydroxythreonine-4-phosphate dehydrogenase
MRRANERFRTGLSVVEVDSIEAALAAGDSLTTLPCLAVGDDQMLDVPPGTHDARTGQGAYEAICRGIDLALAGEVDGLVTAPISKAALQGAGHTFPGHTELLAHRCGVDEFAMMLYLPPGVANKSPCGLGVVHVTLHMAMRDIFGTISQESVFEKCRLADGAMRAMGVARPRVGVTALNPHGGEAGLFGREEIEIIAPGVAQARAAGLDAAGPFPADTLMIAARDGAYDAVVAMYHDQGHIALKLLAMHAAVNVTLGLPIIRTSVAHGTAFDKAWRGEAEITGMLAAIETAARMASRRGCGAGGE